MLPLTINAKWEMSDGFQKYSQPNAIIMHDTLLVSSNKSAQSAFQTKKRSLLLFITSIDAGKLRYEGFLGGFFGLVFWGFVSVFFFFFTMVH